MPADDETEFDFRMPGGVGHLVETALKEAGLGEEDAPAVLTFPAALKKPESREQPTLLIDGQQASIDHAVAASFVVEANPLPPPPLPVVTDDLVLAPRVVVGKPELPPETPLALDVEAIAARPARAPTRTPVHLPQPETTTLPRGFWIAVAVLTVALIAYSLFR